MFSALFNSLAKLIHTMLCGLDEISKIFSPPPPTIPPYTRKKMIEYGIGYKELMQAYHSKRTEPGYKPGSTCGVYLGKNLAVGAVYIRDEKNPQNFIIIGCWSKKISDYWRKFGNVQNQYSKKRY